MIVIAKNNIGSDIYLQELEGTMIPVGEQVTMSERFGLTEYNNNSDFVTLVTNGDIVINDGTDDLSAGDGVRYVQLTLSGSNTYTNVGAPSGSLGEDYDLYINTITGEYYRKEDDTWELKGEFGKYNYTGTGDPSVELGINGDIYIDVEGGKYYLKESDVWELKGDFGTIPAGEAPPEIPTDGSQWYYSQTGVPYYWDTTRDKWLSTSKIVFIFTKKGTASGSYLRIGEIINDDAGFYVHQDATITGIYCSSVTGNETKTFEVRDAADNHAVLGSFSFLGGVITEYSASDVSDDIPGGALLQIYVTSGGGVIGDVMCEIELSLRFESAP